MGKLATVSLLCLTAGGVCPARDLPGLALRFEPNRGQFPPEARFAGRHGRGAVVLTPTESIVRFAGAELRIRLLGANAEVELRGLDPQPGKSNYSTKRGPPALPGWQ